MVNSGLVTYASTGIAVSKPIGNPAAVVVYNSQMCDLSRNPEAGDVDLRIVEMVYVDMGSICRCSRAAEYLPKQRRYSFIGCNGGFAFHVDKEQRQDHVVHLECYGAAE